MCIEVLAFFFVEKTFSFCTFQDLVQFVCVLRSDVLVCFFAFLFPHRKHCTKAA